MFVEIGINDEIFTSDSIVSYDVHGTVVQYYLHNILQPHSIKYEVVSRYSTYMYVPFLKLWFWYILVCTGMYKYLSVRTVLYHHVLVCTGTYQNVHSCPGVSDSRWKAADIISAISIHEGINIAWKILKLYQLVSSIFTSISIQSNARTRLI